MNTYIFLLGCQVRQAIRTVAYSTTTRGIERYKLLFTTKHKMTKSINLNISKDHMHRTSHDLNKKKFTSNLEKISIKASMLSNVKLYL